MNWVVTRTLLKKSSYQQKLSKLCRNDNVIIGTEKNYRKILNKSKVEFYFENSSEVINDMIELEILDSSKKMVY